MSMYSFVPKKGGCLMEQVVVNHSLHLPSLLVMVDEENEWKE